MPTQLSFLPDNDKEPVVKRPSQPLVIYENGRYLWKEIDGPHYLPAPELEAILLAAQPQQQAA